MSSITVRDKLKNIFARWGCPNKLITHNGPQFSGSAIAQFSQEYDFRHTTTSPHYAQSNGEDVRAVQTAKQILKQTDPFLALMSYRPTPLQATGVSPSQLMLGRPELEPGDRVTVKLDNERGWTKTAEVLKQCDSPRSYLVQTDRCCCAGTVTTCGPSYLLQRLQWGVAKKTSSAKDSCAHLFQRLIHLLPHLHSPSHQLQHVTSSGRLVRPPDKYRDYVR